MVIDQAKVGILKRSKLAPLPENEETFHKDCLEGEKVVEKGSQAKVGKLRRSELAPLPENDREPFHKDCLEEKEQDGNIGQTKVGILRTSKLAPLPKDDEEPSHKDSIEGEKLSENGSQAKVGRLRISELAPMPEKDREPFHKDCLKEEEQVEKRSQTKVVILRAPVLATRPPTEEEKFQKDENPDQTRDTPVRTEVQKRDANKKRKRNEKQTIIPYLCGRGTQAKVRKLFVSDLEEGNDLPQSNPATKKETAEELLYKDCLKRRNPVTKQTDLGRKDLVKESDLPHSIPETRAERESEQVYEGCLEGRENSKKEGSSDIHVGKSGNQIKVGRLKVSDLARRSDSSQSNPVADEEMGEEQFHKDNLVEESSRIKTSLSSDSIRWEKKSLERALKSSTDVNMISENKYEESGGQDNKDLRSRRRKNLEEDIHHKKQNYNSIKGEEKSYTCLTQDPDLSRREVQGKVDNPDVNKGTESKEDYLSDTILPKVAEKDTSHKDSLYRWTAREDSLKTRSLIKSKVSTVNLPVEKLRISKFIRSSEAQEAQGKVDDPEVKNVTRKDTGHKESSCTETAKVTLGRAGTHRRTKVSKSILQAKSEDSKISGKIKKGKTTKIHGTSSSIRKYLVEHKPEDQARKLESGDPSKKKGDDLQGSDPADDSEQKTISPRKWVQETESNLKEQGCFRAKVEELGVSEQEETESGLLHKDCRENTDESQSRIDESKEKQMGKKKIWQYMVHTAKKEGELLERAVVRDELGQEGFSTPKPTRNGESPVRRLPMQSTKEKENSKVVRKPPRKEDASLIKETVRRKKNMRTSDVQTITSMFQKKTGTLVMKERTSKREELPPYRADMGTEKESLK